jgi:RNA polymerase sigma-70 factor (sigma-E family)
VAHDDFNAFVTAHLDKWRRSAFLMCQDWHMADDLVADALAKLFRAWRKVAAADNPEAFAQRILTRCWLDERRRPWRRERPSARLPEQIWAPAEELEDRQALERILRSLGPRQRAVLILRFYLCCSVEETADILGISIGTVKSQSARAIAALRERTASFPA